MVKIHEVQKGSNLDFLLRAFLGAYNRRTDVIARSSETEETIKALTQKLKTSEDKVETALNNQPE